MSDVLVLVLVVAVAVGATGLVAVIAVRLVLRDAVAQVRDLTARLRAADAVIEAAEDAGFIQSDHSRGRHAR